MDDNNNINLSGESSADQYIPLHEKLSEDEDAAGPVYDDFMYEPIGFEDLEKQSAIDDTSKPKQKRIRGEAAAILLFSLLLITSAVIAVIGIVKDIIGSPSAVNKILENRQPVLYINSKPDGANDLSNFVDENGKYTIEGAAAAVKDSIVEIYTYGDSSKKILEGTGSGVVISKDGYIVTNAHVLLDKGYHMVGTTSGEVYEAKVIGRDTKTDIAVIKIQTTGLLPAVLGNSDEAVIGEKVIAIGNPAGLSNTVTDGIVSYVGRMIRGESTGYKMSCIQTNAQISPGNSGGALVNMYGQVIGITSSKYTNNGLDEGLGFAIAINEAKPIIEELIKNGYIGGRYKIGIMIMDTSTISNIAAIERELGYSVPDDFKGVYVSKIVPGSDIENTELKPKDFITAINGKTVSTITELDETIGASYGVGDTVPATCAHIEADESVTYYNIKFKLMEDVPTEESSEAASETVPTTEPEKAEE